MENYTENSLLHFYAYHPNSDFYNVQTIINNCSWSCKWYFHSSQGSKDKCNSFGPRDNGQMSKFRFSISQDGV